MRIRNIVEKTVITVILSLMIYISISAFVNYRNVMIQDSFPDKFTINSDYSTSQELSSIIINNAPLSLPYVNPFYLFKVEIVNSSNQAYAYFIAPGDKQKNFTSSIMDMGKILGGERKTFKFYLYPDAGNVNFRMEVYLNFFTKFKAKSYSYSVEHHGNNEYSIRRIS